MSRRRVRSLTACTIAAAATVVGSVAMPGLARGDDGLAEPLAPPAPATALTPQEVVDGALAAVADVVPPTAVQPPPAPITAEGAADDAANAPLETTAAEPPVTETAPGEPVTALETAEDGQNGVDTTPVAGDIALDTPHPAPGEPPVDAGPTQPEQDAPAPEIPPAADGARTPTPVQANVNVSVRIGSPGDDGPVTQVNVASGGSQPGRPGGATAPQPARNATGPEQAAADPDGTWYWRWDCLDVGSLGAISPFGSATGSVPGSWTWIWNCGDKSTQYRGESDVAFRQVNANVSIRFASPGDNGAVAQVNVGAGVSVSVPAPTVPRLPVLPSVPPAQLPQLPAMPVAVTVAAPVPAPQTQLLPGATGDITLPPPVSAPPVAAPSGGPAAISPLPPSAAEGSPAAGALLPFGAGFRVQGPQAAAPPETRVDGTAVRGAGAALSTGRMLAPASGAVSRPAPRPVVEERRAAPRRRPTPPRESAPLRLSTASVAAAAGGGGSSGSGIPFLLALPFVAALLDLARRVALEHATWPSGHRRRAPDRPG